MGTSSPLVSIIIPVYNTRHTLKRAVQSVIRQTYKNWELILIDDASTDGSAELCDRCAEKEGRIRVIHQPKNQGVEVARYTAIQAVRGEYVMFCDSDDWMTHDIVEHCVDIALREQVDAVHFMMYRVYDNLALLKQSPQSEQPRRLNSKEITTEVYPLYFGKSGQYVSTCNYLYAKRVFDAADIVPLGQKILEDQVFNMRVMPYIQSIYLSDKCGYYYRYGGRTSAYHIDTHEQMKQLYHFELKCLSEHLAEELQAEAKDFAGYELKNNFLHHIEELIMLGLQQNEVKDNIIRELADPIYEHVLSVFARSNDLREIDRAFLNKDVDALYHLCSLRAKSHRRRRLLAKIAMPILRYI